MNKVHSEESRYRANRQGEIDSAAVYRAMAAAERTPQLASVYERLAQVEERHLQFWEEQLRALGREPGPGNRHGGRAHSRSPHEGSASKHAPTDTSRPRSPNSPEPSERTHTAAWVLSATIRLNATEPLCLSPRLAGPLLS
jgi:hypothetical protein